MRPARPVTDDELIGIRPPVWRPLRRRVYLPDPYFKAGVCRDCKKEIVFQHGKWLNAYPVRKNGVSRGRLHICGTLG